MIILFLSLTHTHTQTRGVQKASDGNNGASAIICSTHLRHTIFAGMRGGAERERERKREKKAGGVGLEKGKKEQRKERGGEEVRTSCMYIHRQGIQKMKSRNSCTDGVCEDLPT